MVTNTLKNYSFKITEKTEYKFVNFIGYYCILTDIRKGFCDLTN